LEQTQATRDSYSGVNLDEEAADLIRFEQLYQANARVISVAREMFDTLLQSL
jgi:flagellar hook-associated protein 1